jgi:hypothetical protein
MIKDYSTIGTMLNCEIQPIGFLPRAEAMSDLFYKPLVFNDHGYALYFGFQCNSMIVMETNSTKS